MKILIIPDVHGEHHWEKVKSISESNYDYAVFLGDYFDSGIYSKEIKAFIQNNKWPNQGENFQNICNWVREKPDTRKICLGNHDWSVLRP